MANTRVGLVTYANNGFLNFGLDRYFNEDEAIVSSYMSRSFYILIIVRKVPLFEVHTLRCSLIYFFLKTNAVLGCNGCY